MKIITKKHNYNSFATPDLALIEWPYPIIVENYVKLIILLFDTIQTLLKTKHFL